jgi:NAD+ diphosphatase
MPDPITFAGGTLDRAAHRRTDAAWLEEMSADALAVVGGRGGVRLELEPLDDRDGVFLGVRDDGVALWAVEAGEDDELTDLRASAPALPDADAGLFAYAQSLLHWHRTHRFCGRCGEPLRPIEAGFARVCAREHVVHPRTDPVAIMLVVDDDRALLGRQPHWPEGRYSALAGFVEPGESLEAAVRREVREESGVEVGEVRYRASQPWPFPASLMIGFEADYAGGSVRADEDELEDARWFSREELADGDLILPPRMAIARRLIEAWLA